MDLNSITAEWYLGLFPPEKMPMLAVWALEQGFDGPALRELAGCTTATYPDEGSLIERALRELWKEPLDLSSAGQGCDESSTRWLLREGHGRPADPFRCEVNLDLDTVGNFDKRNSFVHPLVFTVEGHCSFNCSRARPLTANDKRQLLLLGYSSYREVAVEYDRIGTSLFNLR
jgi:hypothetical protein